MDGFIIELFWPTLNTYQYPLYYGGKEEKLEQLKWLAEKNFDCRIIAIFNVKFK